MSFKYSYIILGIASFLAGTYLLIFKAFKGDKTWMIMHFFFILVFWIVGIFSIKEGKDDSKKTIEENRGESPIQETQR